MPRSAPRRCDPSTAVRRCPSRRRRDAPWRPQTPWPACCTPGGKPRKRLAGDGPSARACAPPWARAERPPVASVGLRSSPPSWPVRGPPPAP
eukprot:scaffold650_cov249-Pinguiococcus_pyrenoidosus.AAC.14